MQSNRNYYVFMGRLPFLDPIKKDEYIVDKYITSKNEMTLFTTPREKTPYCNFFTLPAPRYVYETGNVLSPEISYFL